MNTKDSDEEILKDQVKKDCKFQEVCKREKTRLAGACFTGGITVFKGKTYPCFIFDKKSKELNIID